MQIMGHAAPEPTTVDRDSSYSSVSGDEEDFASVLGSMEAAANVSTVSHRRTRSGDSASESDSTRTTSSKTEEHSAGSAREATGRSESKSSAQENSTAKGTSTGKSDGAGGGPTANQDKVQGAKAESGAELTTGKNLLLIGKGLLGLNNGLRTAMAVDSVRQGGNLIGAGRGVLNTKQKSVLEKSGDGTSSKALSAGVKGVGDSKNTTTGPQGDAAETIKGTGTDEGVEEAKLVGKSKQSQVSSGLPVQEEGKGLFRGGKSGGAAATPAVAQDAQAPKTASEALIQSVDSSEAEGSAKLNAGLHEGSDKGFLKSENESSTSSALKARHTAGEGVDSTLKAGGDREFGTQLEEQTQAASEKNTDVRTAPLRSNGAAVTNAEVVSQVRTQLEEMVSKVTWTGTQKATLNLNPPHLGSVDVDVIVRGDHVKAVFTASTPLVREALESGMDMLKQSLSGAGMGDSDADVFLKQGDSQGKENTGKGRGSRSNTSEDETLSATGAIEEGLLHKFRQGQGEHSIYVRA
jgi:flagellar hook-length control protein FliK